ncbi:MAG: hypothetical protein VX152_12225, partial [Pseudomonadota bacterium]|nr:hypothetical protein [Pseudomonadota bacterium]
MIMMMSRRHSCGLAVLLALLAAAAAAGAAPAPEAPGDEEALRLEWRKSAGKGQQGSAMTNKNMTDTGLTMTIDDLCADLLERGVMGDKTQPPYPPVVGMAVEKVHMNLSALDIKGAFVTAQQGEANRDQIDAAEFVHIVALCGHIKYEEVEAMSLAQCVAGAFANVLQ